MRQALSLTGWQRYRRGKYQRVSTKPCEIICLFFYSSFMSLGAKSLTLVPHVGSSLKDWCAA